MASSLTFKNTTDSFKKQLKEDVSSINSSPDVVIFAEKANNIYKETPKQYKKLLKENVTKTYKKSSDLLKKSINMEAPHIAKKLQLSDKIDHLTRNHAFITLKGHKEHFSSNLLCPLINPSNSELGKSSKQKLEKINKVMVQYLNVNQQKNSASVIQWLTALQKKTHSVFIKFDARECYPSITEDISKTSLSFANEQQNIPEEDICIMNHCRQSLLFSNNQSWKKMMQKAALT